MAKTLDEIIAGLHKAADSSVPAIRDAFLAAIAEIRNSLTSVESIQAAVEASMQSPNAIVAATKVDDLDNLLFGIGMNNSAFVFSAEVQSAFIAGALAGINNLSDAKQKQIAFNALNERAVNIMRNRAAATITDLTTTTREGVQSVIIRAMNDNIPPTKMAREIRQLIGLTDPQATAVTNFRRQLETRSNLGFTPAYERRLNAVEQTLVRQHMRVGTFSDENIDAMVERYYESLLNRRALDIARTESMSAVNAGQVEMYEQGLDLGIFDDNVDRKFWIVTPDDRLRATHAAIPNMNPSGVKIRSYFITPFGLVFSPGDYNVNLINCRCVTVLGEFGQSFIF